MEKLFCVCNSINICTLPSNLKKMQYPVLLNVYQRQTFDLTCKRKCDFMRKHEIKVNPIRYVRVNNSSLMYIYSYFYEIKNMFLRYKKVSSSYLSAPVYYLYIWYLYCIQCVQLGYTFITKRVKLVVKLMQYV